MLFCLGNGDKKKRIAFTLTEMLIALVVVAILAVLILPAVIWVISLVISSEICLAAVLVQDSQADLLRVLI